MNGHSATNATRLFKSALTEAARTATSPLADPTSPLLVRVGLPTQNQRARYHEIIATTRVTCRQEVAAMSPRRPRELIMVCTLIVSVHRAGSDDETNGVDLEEVVSLRAGELHDAIETQVRLTDTTLGGVVRECFCTNVEINEPDELINSGRAAYAIGEFTARARITWPDRGAHPMSVKIRNVSPYGPLDTPLLRHVEVAEFGEPIEVTEEQAQILLAQHENWAPVDKPAIAICAATVADQIERELAATGEPLPSAKKPEWVAFAASKGDPDPSGKTIAQLREAYATEQPDPQEVAAALAQRGEELAASAPAPSDPPGNPPGGSGDDAGDDNSKGDQS